MRERVRSILSSIDAPLAVAVSGGLDSSLLLAIVDSLLKTSEWQPKIKPFVIHINHNLRGEESVGDAAFVRRQCEDMNLEFRSFSLAWNRGELATQNSCRVKREAVFSALRTEIPKLRIAFAHHQDDLAETIFLRILRGTGLRGLMPMQEINLSKIRPLLRFTRSQILSTAQEMGLKWREDSSNKKCTYNRNWIRNEIFPILEARYPRFSEKLVALSIEAQENIVRQKKTEKIVPVYQFGDDFSLFKQADLKKIDTAQLSKLFSLNRKHSVKVQTQLNKDSAKYSLPGNKFLWISGGHVLVSSKDFAWPNFNLQNNGLATSILGEWQLESVGEGFCWRKKKSAENSTIKRALIKRKIPAFLRAEIPVLVTHDGEKVFIPRKIGKDEEWQLRDFKITYRGVNSILRNDR